MGQKGLMLSLLVGIGCEGVGVRFQQRHCVEAEGKRHIFCRRLNLGFQCWVLIDCEERKTLAWQEKKGKPKRWHLK